MSEDPLLDGSFFSAARAVASCPATPICRSEFQAKGESKADGTHWQLAALPSPDFIGARYRGLVVIGANPGLAHTPEHHRNDARMFRLQQRIAEGDETAFAELCSFLPISMATWRQMVDIESRKRLNFDIQDIAYINLVKCGTRPGGGSPQSLFRGTGILGRCWEMHTRALLEILKPTHVVALWKPIVAVIEGLGFPLKTVVHGYHSGARNLAIAERYAAAAPVFDEYYSR